MAACVVAPAALQACGGEPASEVPAKPQEPARAHESGGPDSTSSEPEPYPLAQRAPLDPGLAERWKRRSAAADGWDSEVLHDRAGQTLSALGELLASGEPIQPESLEPWCSAKPELSPLRPTERELTRSGPRAKAWIARPVAPRAVDRAGFAAELRALAEAFEPGQAKAAFKEVRVDLETSPPRTVVLASVWGPAPGGRVQIDATWEISWQIEESGRARIARLALLDYGEVQGTPSPWFSDCTQAVLGSQPSFQSQLLASMEQVASELEIGLGASLIGHHGLALGDVDGDGLEDLFLPQPGGLPNQLFLALPDGTLVDRSREAGVDFLDPSRSALLVDLDGDADLDLVAELDPYLALLENDGRAHFALRGRLEASGTTSMAAADVDLDGDLDLYACAYALPDDHSRTPLPYHDANNGRPNTLFENLGDFEFANATRASGLDQNNRRFSFACSFEDFDADGDQDLYVANDFGRNNLYLNQDGQFRDVASERGVEDLAAGMGVTWADFDLDGRTDLYVSNMFSSAGERIAYQRRFQAGAADQELAGLQRHARGNSLFLQQGDGTFVDGTLESRTWMGRWAWGAIACDLDDDGRRDLFVPNGYVTGSDPEDL
jgi:hypothetical protein